ITGTRESLHSRSGCLLGNLRMRKNGSSLLMAVLGLVCIASSNQASAQPWSGIIESLRAVDWSRAGVAGGIPHRTQICATLSPGASISQINRAIADCPPNQVVLLGAGTYNLGSGTINLRDNVTLRGAGAHLTKLVFSGR